MKISLSSKDTQRLLELGVVALYLFGSRAQGVENTRSDFDFAVFMDTDGHTRGDTTYDALYDILSPLCSRTLENDVLDIVFLNDAPLELRMHVLRYGKVMYSKDTRRQLYFEEKTVLEYCDFRPILDMVDATILASV